MKIGRRLRKEIGASKQVLGTTKVAELFEMSRFWARKLLESWFAEQNAGGEVRVIPSTDSRGRIVLRTTLGVVLRYLPAARDERLVKSVKRIDDDLDLVARRVDRLLSTVDMQEKRIAYLERRPKRP